MVTGSLPNEDIAKLYLLGASSAEQLKNYTLMLSYSEQADSVFPTTSSANAEIVALIHLGFKAEVGRRLALAVKKYPTDQHILALASHYNNNL